MTYKYVKIPIFYRLGVVACSCDPATWRPELVDGVKAGVLLSGDLCWAGVRTKIGINMGTPRELSVTRLSKEGRKGPGRKRSRQKSPCRSVVGSRLWIGTCQQPVQYNWTRFFFFPHLLVCSLVSNISFRGFQKYYIVNIWTSCSYFINAFNLVWLLNVFVAIGQFYGRHHELGDWYEIFRHFSNCSNES